MPEAKISIQVPGGTWIESVSRRFPAATFEVVSTLGGRDDAIGLVELHVDDPGPVVAATRDHPELSAVELLWTDDEGAIVQVEATAPVPLQSLWRAGVPLKPPIEVRDGVATWRLATSEARLSALGRQLEAAGIEYDVEHVHPIEGSPGDGLLTDRQRELLDTAIESGYYRTPRTATLTEVAGDAGVAKSTASDVLHRAEGKIVEWFAEQHDPGRV